MFLAYIFTRLMACASLWYSVLGLLCYYFLEKDFLELRIGCFGRGVRPFLLCVIVDVKGAVVFEKIFLEYLENCHWLIRNIGLLAKGPFW